MASPYGGIYVRVAQDQRDRGMSCPSTRFFLLSRFDQALELQDAAFSNVVFQVLPKDFHGALTRHGPRRDRCDAVVVTREDAESYGERTLETRLGAGGP